MTHLVTRTCTEVRPHGESRGAEPASRPLNAFRSAPAYVLLGDPGSGKTTAFEHEYRELGAAAILLDARDFLTLDSNSRPEWREKTLFIDGLDEVRAGASDTRTPLDDIRGRLDALGCPQFRISCREADWLGESDRSRLAVVARESTIATLRLDPLTDSDIVAILSTRPSIDSPQFFIEQAEARGVGGLLSNPQTLNMLADVVGGWGGWPQSRLETFEMACLQMAAEHNKEHSHADQLPPRNALLDAAGYLCSAQLLTGTAGYTFGPGKVDSAYIALDDCDYVDSAALRPALSTRLFKGVHERRFTPIHRHVAEFLGARHLARLITEGLPARRVLALISGADGVVVTEMRGLSGWLAAQCGAVRGLLVERDPIGAALYGDIRGFSTDEKDRLLRALGRREVRTSLGRNVSWFEIDSAFGALASPDMEPVIEDILAEPSRDSDHEGLIQFVLTLLWQGSPLPSLAPSLLAMVRDDTWPPHVRSLALNGFLHATAGAEGHTAEFKELLAGVHAGTIPDPDNQMRGALLARLYPAEVPPSSIWDYLTERGNRHLMGHYWAFQEHDLLRQSSDEDVAELLDQLSERRADVLPALESHYADSLPMRLLARGLEAHGDEVPVTRLYAWMRAATPQLGRGFDPEDDSLGRVRDWLGQRSEIQKAMLSEGLRRCPDSDRYYHDAHEVWGALHGSSLPLDFGLWCLDQAVELAPLHSKASEDLLWRAFREWREQGNARGLSRRVLTERVRGHAALEKRLSALAEGVANSEAAAVHDTVERSKAEEERAREREEEISYVRSNAEALRKNRASIGLLDGLGRAYFLYRLPGARHIFPVERVSELLGGDQSLIEAALAGLRETLWRSDVPDFGEIIRLQEVSRRHPLDFAFLAGLDILQQEDPSRLEELSQSQMQTGLAFYYCTPAGFTETPAWHIEWTDRFPELVAEVAARCTLSAIRHGDGYSPALETIRRLEAHPTLRHETSLRLLAKFPSRAALKKLETLDSLLWTALADPDRSSLLDLIDGKLSLRSMGVAQRVRWLAAGAVAAPEAYGARMEAFVREGERRVRGLAAFFDSRESSFPLPFPNDESCAPALGALIALMGRSFAPTEGAGFVTLEMTASGQISRLIRQLASLPGGDALQALDSLVSQPDLVHWRDQLVRARDDQRAVHRDAAYRHPDLEQLHHALRNQEPANAGDLAALVLDRLSTIASVIRTGNTDDWRQYWNEDSDRHPLTPKHENSCRDALLSSLRATLPSGVDAQREGQYAGNKRADIRVTHGASNVPVEIKKDTHPDLWSAIRRQLIAQYTRDLETSGYGIYLVLWFGEAGMPPPPTGTRPKTPGELQQRLEETLTADEALKTEVLVVDVSPVT